MKKITKIERRLSFPEPTKLLRVAAYARVSTDEEKQQNSLEAQTDYYRTLINSNKEWVFAGIYADNGISGLSYHNREAFKRMIADCDAGCIDMIITKSISRFARNTVDTIKVIRHLKELGIGVMFEKEGIWSLDGKGEFVLTLMASFAQEESRSISENVSWGIKKYFADGNYCVPYNGFLGYGRGFVIEEEGALIVRKIYKYYLQGYSAYQIARILEKQGCRTPRDGEHPWLGSVVSSILRNEKYKGDALTQKTYIASFLTKKRVKNKGEVVRHYVTGGHEPIIPPVIFDYVQEMINSRKEVPGRYSGVSLLSNKFICSRCGEKFGSKSIHSNDKYKHTLWQCQNRFRKGSPCKNRHFHENEMPELMNTMFTAVTKRYPEIKRNTLNVVEEVIGAERMKDIRKFISHLPADKLKTEPAEWAMLVENSIVYDKTLKVRLFGGIEIIIRR